MVYSLEDVMRRHAPTILAWNKIHPSRVQLRFRMSVSLCIVAYSTNHKRILQYLVPRMHLSDWWHLRMSEHTTLVLNRVMTGTVARILSIASGN